jgi:hypothetical protein
VKIEHRSDLESKDLKETLSMADRVVVGKENQGERKFFEYRVLEFGNKLPTYLEQKEPTQKDENRVELVTLELNSLPKHLDE